MAHNGMVIKILIANMALYVTSLVPLVPAITQEVSFINVGQGDSILIRDGYHAALLDTGGNISFDMAEEVLIPYLRKKRIYHLDYLIASHGDYDHIGAKDSLLKNFSAVLVLLYCHISKSLCFVIGLVLNLKSFKLVFLIVHIWKQHLTEYSACLNKKLFGLSFLSSINLACLVI
jgi:hypothetical protein